MQKDLNKLIDGYSKFRQKYVENEVFVLEHLHLEGQNPQVIIVSCCDSRVDPALLLQCDPGDLFVIRNIANIIPPYENDSLHHGTSAALEFGVNVLDAKHIIIFGHSQCGGIKSWINRKKNDICENKTHEMSFIDSWVSVIDIPEYKKYSIDECAKLAMRSSYKNCLTFPFIKEKINKKNLMIHLWFFDIKTAQILSYNENTNTYNTLI